MYPCIPSAFNSEFALSSLSAFCSTFRVTNSENLWQWTKGSTPSLPNSPCHFWSHCQVSFVKSKVSWHRPMTAPIHPIPTPRNQAVSDTLLTTAFPANLTKYWHLRHVHRFCISLPPPSFAWVWHNGIQLLHRSTCPRAKQAERSQALCHKLSQDACETCEKNVQTEDPLPLKLAFQH